MADKISENLRAKQRSKQHSKGRPVEPETDKKGNEQVEYRLRHTLFVLLSLGGGRFL